MEGGGGKFVDSACRKVRRGDGMMVCHKVTHDATAHNRPHQQLIIVLYFITIICKMWLSSCRKHHMKMQGLKERNQAKKTWKLRRQAEVKSKQ